MGKLSATAVKATNAPGRYGDGDGLFLLVGRGGGKSWMVRVQKDGKRRDIGLGCVAKVPFLARAWQRFAALSAHECLSSEPDPTDRVGNRCQYCQDSFAW